MIKEFSARDLTELRNKANNLNLTKDNIITILYVQSEYKIIYDDGRNNQL